MFTAGILTISDKGAAGEREDASGEVIKELLQEAGYQIERYHIVPDEREAIEKELLHMSDHMGLNLILTTGGTGFGPRDITPEVTKSVIDREAPGISEAMRINSLSITPKGMLSRGVSGIRGRALIVNLPGSPKAVRESLEYILSPLKHGLEILLGRASECAR
ncbi:MAG: MogA/MoaB family molybdenum cofactor biosynthesis protein [Bacillota bacterium]|nr:MogA/MoaB family molybdenum cofactor biosynthesis protein [Bacillota bacterium]NLM07987.1 MogA/MoaB family molybdenum cofactor biosynthesis protein [Clostridiales Family XIII bacterium]